MTLPANIRVNIGAPFPAKVKGSGPVTVAKRNGIWTVGFTISNLAAVPAGTDPTTLALLVYNTTLQTFQQMTLAALLPSLAVVPTSIGIAQSPYTVLPSDSLIFVDSSGGPVVINLQLAAARLGRPLSIKDVTGNAATAGHNISIIPHGAETIESINPLLINAAYGGYQLYPATGKYVIAP